MAYCKVCIRDDLAIVKFVFVMAKSLHSRWHTVCIRDGILYSLYSRWHIVQFVFEMAYCKVCIRDGMLYPFVFAMAYRKVLSPWWYIVKFVFATACCKVCIRDNILQKDDNL